MQNTFTSEHSARITIDRYHAEARRHETLKLAHAGHPRRSLGGSLMTAVGVARERLESITHRQVATTRPVCQPGMAC